MPNRYTAVVGSEFTLDAQFTLNSELVDVYAVKRVEIQDADGNVLKTVQDVDVVHVSTGIYRVTVPALTSGGDLFDSWFYTPVEDAALDALVLEVSVAEFSGAGEDADDAITPALEDENICIITATFRDASGEPVQGVLVRFSPAMETNANTAFGFVSKPITAQSDEDGVFSLRLIRGLKGVLSVTGINLVRQITVPDVDTIGLFSLVNDAVDPFAVQSLDDFIELPRSS